MPSANSMTLILQTRRENQGETAPSDRKAEYDDTAPLEGRRFIANGTDQRTATGRANLPGFHGQGDAAARKSAAKPPSSNRNEGHDAAETKRRRCSIG